MMGEYSMLSTLVEEVAVAGGKTAAEACGGEAAGS